MKRILFSILIFCSTGIFASGQTTEFTYQGILNAGTPPTLTTVNYDFEFRLFSIDTGGSAIATLQRLNVPVENGAFTVKLDFGDNFPGAPRYLEIAVRLAGGGAFQTLLPRQAINSTPYSITASNALKLGGTAANQYLLTNGNGSALTNLNAGNISTGTLAVANGGTGSSTKNFVDLSTNQTGIGGNKTFTGNLTVNGSVGIGTAPATKLDVSGTGGVRARVNSDSNAGLALTLNNNPGWSVATVTGGQFQIFNDAIGQNAVWITPATNNVGIGTSTPGAKLDVNGDIKASGTITGPRTTMSLNTANIVPGSTPTTIPGMSQTINVSGNAKLLIQYRVRVQDSDAFNATAWIDLAINSGVASTSEQVVGGLSVTYISGSWLMSVGAGTHTVEVKASSTSGTGIVLAFGGFGTARSNLIVQVIPE